jgi:hypothetical protein
MTHPGQPAGARRSCARDHLNRRGLQIARIQRALDAHDPLDRAPRALVSG